MRMVTRTAIANMKYHKSKNILTGIAIFLTTVLLFIVPSVGIGSIDVQFAMVNQTYPVWHALFRSVDADTAAGLMAHHDIETGGLRGDVGAFYNDNADISAIWVDAAASELYRLELSEGTFPEKADELVVSKGMLKEFGISAEIGDRITLPFQKYLPDGLDFAQDKEFEICGFLPDNDSNLENHVYVTLISEAFLNSEIPREEREYRFLFRTAGISQSNTDEIKAQIRAIGESFGIPETDTNINQDYLMANYTDPALFSGIVSIMLVIIASGIITIYGIYYISMTQRIQEFGRLKAIGATKRQIRQIVLREGLCTACLAIPAGLIVSSLLLKPILLFLGRYIDTGNASDAGLYTAIIKSPEICLYKWQIYLLTIAVTLLTVYLSLFLPMRRAQKISPVEAMRYQNSQIRQTLRKGYRSLSIKRLAQTNLAGNKKRSFVTVLAMSITGILVIAAATVLSCANPKESADNDIYGQYHITLNIENGNKEHPEQEWTSIIQDNPLSEKLKEQIESLDGVREVIAFTYLPTDIDFPDTDTPAADGLLGLPESCFPELKKGIVEGSAEWEDLLSGNKIILNQNVRYWYPELNLKPGDTLRIQIQNGPRTVSRDLEIIAIGDYPFGMVEYNSLIISKDAADQILTENCTGDFHIMADADYEEELAEQLTSLTENDELLKLNSWQAVYEDWKQSMSMIRTVCFAFLAILGMICIMNLINTMINSIHIRKKELGIMQAVGMTNAQMAGMLRIEGLFYTLSILMISIGGGSALGYAAYLLAKKNDMFSITTYHFPAAAVVIVILVLTLVQLLLTGMLSHSVKKESLIERIRFSE